MAIVKLKVVLHIAGDRILSKYIAFTLTSFLALISLVPRTQCQDPGLVFTQPEEQPIGYLVGSVSTYGNLQNMVAKDEIPNLRYSILSGATGGSEYFNINTTTGNIYFSKRVDREAVCRLQNVCEINIRVAVSGQRNFFSTIPVKIYITDINDNSPVFPPPGVLQIHISEAASENFTQVLPPATDADNSREFGVQSYTLEPANEKFDVLVSRNFVGTPHVSLVLKQKLDRELVDNYTLYVVAKDGGIPPKSVTLTVRVIVDDVNDNDPRFSEKVYAANFSEEAGWGFLVTTVTATDSDVGDNGKVVYELNSVLSGNSGDVRDRIQIDNNTGAVTLKRSLVSGEYRFLIDARDLGNPPRMDQAVVSVSVMDTVNDPPIVRLNPVQIDNLPIGWVSEGSGVSTVVAVVSVEDLDTGRNGTVTCMSLEPTFDLQLLEEKRYKVTVARPLDREANSTYTVSVICRDNGVPSLSATANFTLNVFDLNDNIPVFEQSTYVQEMAENNAGDNTVLVVSAVDADEGQNGVVEYRLENDEGNFRIIPETGVIKATRRFDREERDHYTLRVLAVDHGEPALTGTATVNIIVSDVNDVHPIFPQDIYKFQIYENKDTGSVVGNVTVTDPDLGPGGTVAFTLKSVNESDNNPFVINPDGRIIGLVHFDREQTDFYTFYVIATDQGIPKLSSSALVEVEILDVNDIRPTFVFPSDQNFTALIQLPVKQDVAILKVTVHDSDDNHNGLITYSLADTNASNLLRIGLISGEVFPNRDLEPADIGTYFITINVTDQGIPSLWDARVLYIIILADPSLDDGANYNVLIVSCIVCFTVIVSGAVLVVICFVSRNDQRKTLPTLSLFHEKQSDRELVDVIEDTKPRMSVSRGSVKESSVKRDHVSYHQQPHQQHHIASDITIRRPSEQSSGFECQVHAPGNTVLVVSPSYLGRQVSDLKPHKHEDFLSTISAETGTGDSGHGSDEDMSCTLEHTNSSVAIPDSNSSLGKSSIHWNQSRPHMAPPFKPHYSTSPVRLPSKLSISHSSTQQNSVKFNPQVTSLNTHRQLVIDEARNNNITSSTYTPQHFPTTSTHRVPNSQGRSIYTRPSSASSSSAPQNASSSTAPQNASSSSAPQNASSSSAPQIYKQGRFPFHLQPHRQIAFVQQSSFGDDDNSDDSDVNTTTSGSYSVISEDMGRGQRLSGPCLRDMYV